MQLRSLLRKTSWTLATAVGAGVLAGFGAASGAAQASALDIRHDSYASTPIAATTYVRNDLRSSYASSRRPVRHRIERYEPSTPKSFLTLGGGLFEPSNQPGNGMFLSGTLGTEVAPPLDLGFAFQWYHRSTGGSSYITTSTDPAGNTVNTVVEADQVDTDLLPLMGFFRLKIPNAAIQPYVGAGAGWEWMTVEGIDDQGYPFHNDYDGFGAQFFGGMNLKLGSGVAFYGEALYNLSTVSAEFFDPYYGVNLRDEIDMDGIAAHGGLRFRF
ncbi:MAG TPA: hypothetical protein VFS09_08570 [Candidatus Eisenbacteria bacterium]|nr:hypothetical protein [Candidatus Eisenbacteria bacterium]